MIGIKLNLGAGYKKVDGYLNVDIDPATNPDYNFDLEGTWPLEDNTVTHVIAEHVLEHLGDGYFNFLKELYRVCKGGAKIEVKVPDHKHDTFYDDPTHRRPITVNGMKLFSKAHNKYCIEINDSASRLGLFYDVDFEIIKQSFNIDPFYRSFLNKLQPGSEEEREFQIMVRERSNMIVEVAFTMVVVKDD